MSTLEISAGTIYYEEAGPSERQAGRVRARVLDGLAKCGARSANDWLTSGCGASHPTWPMGAHSQPHASPAPIDPSYGVAGTVAEVLDGPRPQRRRARRQRLWRRRHAARRGAPSRTGRCHWCSRVVMPSRHFPPPILNPVLLAAKSKTLFRISDPGYAVYRSPASERTAALAHRDVDDLARQYGSGRRMSDPAIAEDLRQLTLSFRTEVTTGVAARLPEFDKPALIAWSADDVFFPSAATANDSPRPSPTPGSR